MKNNDSKRSGNRISVLVILGVLILTILGGWYLISDGDLEEGTVPGSSDAFTKAPAGAVPPNLLGSENATVIVEEFADYKCGACANAFPDIKKTVAAYGDKIKFIFRSFPVTGGVAKDAALAAEAVRAQDPEKFWLMQELLFTNQSLWGGGGDHNSVFVGFAGQLGLDIERFKNDMASTEVMSRVEEDIKRGKALGVRSTPTLFINNVQLPYQQIKEETMKRRIDGLLKK